MDDRTRATKAAATAARELLQGYKEKHLGWTDDRTPVGDLVSWLGLEVETFHPNDYPQGTYGFLEPGEDLIWLCRDLSSSLHRFTLAHELGHALSLMHVNLPENLMSVGPGSRDPKTWIKLNEEQIVAARKVAADGKPFRGRSPDSPRESAEDKKK